MGAENYEDWRRAVSDPSVVAAMVGDYRAGWEDLYGDPVAVWRPWIDAPLEAARIDSGHHIAEEAPEQLAATLARFL